ncbi:multidrug efflux pump subunit AcrB [Paraburkholderia sp. Clong3]|nr:multidrug efflux pump subunit AcrB [Paraburkholderia sp. CI2]
MVDIDPRALQAKGLAPLDVVNAVNAQNLILPGGTAKIGTKEYNVQMNGSTDTIAALNDLPTYGRTTKFGGKIDRTAAITVEVASTRQGQSLHQQPRFLRLHRLQIRKVCGIAYQQGL